MDMSRLLVVIPFAGLLASSLSSCTVLLAATEKSRPHFESSDTRKEIHDKLGKPRSVTNFDKAIPLKNSPFQRENPDELSRYTKDLPVSSREDFVTRGTYTHGAGGFSQQEEFALYSTFSLFILEPFLAPLATINWIFGRFERNEISVWYSPSGNYVEEHWKSPSR